MMNSALLRAATIGDGFQQLVNGFPTTLRRRQTRLVGSAHLLKRTRQCTIRIMQRRSHNHAKRERLVDAQNRKARKTTDEHIKLRKRRDGTPEVAKSCGSI
jgi:hypothetical protein